MSRLSIEPSRCDLEPGETLRGVVRWQLEDAPKGGELTLRWVVRGKGDRDTKVITEVSLSRLPPASGDDDPYRGVDWSQDDEWALQADDARAFQIELPLEPYSFRGTLFSLQWAIEVVLVPGLKESMDIVVAPGRKPIVVERSSRVPA